MPAFNVRGFPATSDTLYLLSKEGAGAAAPLVAALTDQVFRSAVSHAEAAGGRLDPPMLAVLDEAANICKITELPQLYSHLGSRGMAALWSAATVNSSVPASTTPATPKTSPGSSANTTSRVASMSRDAAGYASWSTSVQRRRIMEPGQVRALRRGQALLLATDASPAMVELQPWYAGERAAQTAAELAAANERLTSYALADLDRDYLERP